MSKQVSWSQCASDPGLEPVGKYLWLVFFHILHIPEGSGVVLGSERGGVPVIPLNNCIHRGGGEVCVAQNFKAKRLKKS